MKRILIIEDEADVVDLLTLNLRRAGQFTISTATDGTLGLRMAREQFPALIVLDLMLPGMDGFEVCRLLRIDGATREIPIIILSARVDAVDRERGFELGADDYVTKPFSPREVVLRVKALAQRENQDSVRGLDWTADGVAISGPRHEVTVGGRKVCLTAIEFRLLTHLIETRGRVQSRDFLLEQVWDYAGSMTTRTVDAHILRLRKKLGKASDVIETVRSYGYRFRQS